MIGEPYGAKQQRRGLHALLCRMKLPDAVMFTRCDCLRLGLLFLQETGRMPSTTDYGPRQHLPSRQVILTQFSTTDAYHSCLLRLCLLAPPDEVMLRPPLPMGLADDADSSSA